MSSQEGQQNAEERGGGFLADEAGSPGRQLEAGPGAPASPSRSESPASTTAAAFAEDVTRRLSHRSASHERYRIEQEIDHGGQGSILRVWDEDLQRPLAMKVMRGTPRSADGGEADSRFLARFFEEARIAGQLDHPGTVPVHELGLDRNGGVYFTMKLVHGEDLRSIYVKVHEGREGWTEARALGVVLKVCEAMAYAHAKGVIHRDLKPGNVMVGRYGEVHVVDWGLARVVTREDHRDPRIAEPERGSSGPGDAEHLRDGSGSPLVTMDGHIIGTPSYMSPEQALARVEEIGPHSDVYAVGAMIYHLLAGHPPYAGSGAGRQHVAILSRARMGPPAPLTGLAPRAPVELVAICDKAMSRDWHRRYRDMSEMADDLRAYLEGRVVRAHRVGAWIELQKWIGRNRPLAASIALGILALAGGLVSTLVLKGHSDQNAELAQRRAYEAQNSAQLAEERRILAEANAAKALEQSILAGEREREALASRNEVLRLSAIRRLDDLMSRSDALWPAHPENSAALAQWLVEARELVAGLDSGPEGGGRGYREVLAELRTRALRWTGAEIELDRRTNARSDELALLEAQREALQRAEDVRTGARPAPEPGPEARPGTPAELNAAAWALVGPERMVFGQEEDGLALAQAAVARARNDLELANHSDTLAWAFLANGLDQEALDSSRASLESAPPGRKEDFRIQNEALEAALARQSSGRPLAELQQALAALEEESAVRRTWTFASDDDSWWHAQLVQLIEGIEELSDPRTGSISGVSAEHGPGIERRLEWAKVVEERTIGAPAAAQAWDSAIRSIAASPEYGGLEIEPQMGLLPVGADPASGLWEFAFLQLGEPPARDASGLLALAEDSAPIFVLLPGGTFAMGAQSGDPAGRNYDPSALAAAEGPVHDVTLAPFFLSKYELTQAQWMRLSGNNPSFFTPDRLSPFWTRTQQVADLAHPVEQVSWTDSQRFCERLGLSLPTEAQWEYAARAGSTEARWVGDDLARLSRAANLSDRFAQTHEGGWDGYEPNLDDGNTAHAQAGSYLPNAFGLHDVLGNVWEWCLDVFEEDYYGRSPSVDPVNTVPDNPRRVFRGAAFNCLVPLARSACRPGYGTADVSLREIGLRPARALIH